LLCCTIIIIKKFFFPTTLIPLSAEHAKQLQENLSKSGKEIDLRFLKVLGTGLCILTCLTAHAAYRVYRNKKLKKQSTQELKKSADNLVI